MRNRFLTLLMATIILVGACSRVANTDSSSGSRQESEVIEVIDLPAPDRDGVMTLERTLAERRSIREYTADPLSWEELGQLLWAAQGLNREGEGRTNPSAGALYPIEVYAVTAQGLYHYQPRGHRVEALSRSDLRPGLAEAALGQEAVGDAPAVFVVCGVFSRTEVRYGGRAERYVNLEAGHVGQSLLLQAVGLGLGAVPIGAFEDSEVQDRIGLPDDHEPLYLIPVGHPAG